MPGSERSGTTAICLGRRASGKVARDRAPENRGIELAGQELVLDDLARIRVRIAVERGVRHHLLVQAVPREPLGGRARREHPDAQRIASGARQIDQIVRVANVELAIAT